MAQKNTLLVSKNVLYVGMVVAVVLLAVVFGKKYLVKIINDADILKIQKNDISSSIETSNQTIKKRATGTENWSQYINEEHKIAFLYPPEYLKNEQEIGNDKIDISIYPASAITKSSVMMIAISNEPFDLLQKSFKETKSNPGWHDTYTDLGKTKINDTDFSGYKIVSKNESTGETYATSQYLAQRGSEVIRINLNSAEEFNSINKLLLNSVLIDGSRFEDPKSTSAENLPAKKTTSAVTISEGWTEYSNEEYGYSITYPDDKKISKINFASFTQTGYGNKVDFYITGIDTIGSIEVKNLKLEEAKDQVIKELAALSANITVRNSSKAKLGPLEYEAEKVVFKYHVADSSDIVKLFIYHNGKTYILTWHLYDKVDPRMEKYSYKSVGEAIFKTFRFL